MMNCGSSSGFGKVSLPAPVPNPEPDQDHTKNSFSNKMYKSCPFTLRSSIVAVPAVPVPAPQHLYWSIFLFLFEICQIYN